MSENSHDGSIHIHNLDPEAWLLIYFSSGIYANLLSCVTNPGIFGVPRFLLDLFEVHLQVPTWRIIPVSK